MGRGQRRGKGRQWTQLFAWSSDLHSCTAKISLPVYLFIFYKPGGGGAPHVVSGRGCQYLEHMCKSERHCPQGAVNAGQPRGCCSQLLPVHRVQGRPGRPWEPQLSHSGLSLSLGPERCTRGALEQHWPLGVQWRWHGAFPPCSNLFNISNSRRHLRKACAIYIVNIYNIHLY